MTIELHFLGLDGEVREIFEIEEARHVRLAHISYLFALVKDGNSRNLHYTSEVRLPIPTEALSDDFEFTTFSKALEMSIGELLTQAHYKNLVSLIELFPSKIDRDIIEKALLDNYPPDLVEPTLRFYQNILSTMLSRRMRFQRWKTPFIPHRIRLINLLHVKGTTID